MGRVRHPSAGRREETQPLLPPPTKQPCPVSPFGSRELLRATSPRASGPKQAPDPAKAALPSTLWGARQSGGSGPGIRPSPLHHGAQRNRQGTLASWHKTGWHRSRSAADSVPRQPSQPSTCTVTHRTWSLIPGHPTLRCHQVRAPGRESQLTCNRLTFLPRDVKGAERCPQGKRGRACAFTSSCK